MDAALASRLASDAPDDRAGAYAALEATEDVALAVASVAPLTAVFARPVEEVDAAELQRGCLALAHLMSLDYVAVGPEWIKDGKWLVACTSEGNALNTALRKPVDELTRADALLCAAEQASMTASFIRFQAMLAAAGMSTMEFLGGMMASPHGVVQGTDERNCRLATLIAEALREEREQMADGLVAGAFQLLSSLCGSRPAAAQHMIELGCIGLAVAELRTMPSSDWVSIGKCPSGRVAAALVLCGSLFSNQLPDPGTPGLLEVLLEVLAAYELSEVSDDTSGFVVFLAAWALHAGRFSASEANEFQIRAAAPAIRFLLDHPHTVAAELGWTTGMMAGFLAADVFGRDEDDDTIQLAQADLDALVRTMIVTLTGEIMGGSFPIPAFYSESLNNLCVSDHHKTLLLRNPDLIPHLLTGLFLDPDHPKGLKAQEILGPHAAPTPLEVQAVFQERYAEALAQLALFPAGKDALLADEAAVAALEELVERGMTDETKEFARNALIGLRGFAEHEAVAAEHVMLSYEWSSQSIIVRINESLNRRGYVTWLDVEQMKGSIMDA